MLGEGRRGRTKVVKGTEVGDQMEPDGAGEQGDKEEASKVRIEEGTTKAVALKRTGEVRYLHWDGAVSLFCSAPVWTRAN